MNISSIKTWFSLCTYSYIGKNTEILKKNIEILSKHLQSYAVLQSSANISSSRIRNKTEVIPLASAFMLLERKSQFLQCFYLLCVISAQILESGGLESSL